MTGRSLRGSLSPKTDEPFADQRKGSDQVIPLASLRPLSPFCSWVNWAGDAMEWLQFETEESSKVAGHAG